ncbi:MAG: hypothetical protein AB7R69_06240 [Candidatus Babeliales bacterium]
MVILKEKKGLLGLVLLCSFIANIACMDDHKKEELNLPMDFDYLSLMGVDPSISRPIVKAGIFFTGLCLLYDHFFCTHEKFDNNMQKLSTTVENNVDHLKEKVSGEMKKTGSSLGHTNQLLQRGDQKINNLAADVNFLGRTLAVGHSVFSACAHKITTFIGFQAKKQEEQHQQHLQNFENVAQDVEKLNNKTVGLQKNVQFLDESQQGLLSETFQLQRDSRNTRNKADTNLENAQTLAKYVEQQNHPKRKKANKSMDEID